MEEKFYTDIHCHILFGVDDGPKTLAESEAMIAAAREEGIRTIYLTPHYVYGENDYDLKLLREHFDQLQQRCAERFVDMTLYLGNEILYTPSVIDALERGEALTLGDSQYILVEFRTGEAYGTIYEGLKNLIEAGYSPIIAHVERYDALYKKLERIEDLIYLGAYIQVNCRSVLGSRVNRPAVWVSRLLKNRCVHFVADDSHNTEGRCPLMEAAAEKLKQKIDPGDVERILYFNPRRLLENKYI